VANVVKKSGTQLNS